MVEPNPSMNRIEIGENIRKRREALGLSQQELGLELGTNAGAVCLIENGQRELKVERLCRIAEILRTTPNQLLSKDTAAEDTRWDDLQNRMKALPPEQAAKVFEMINYMIMGMETQQKAVTA